MFRAILRMQWRESRLALLLLAGAGVAIPLLSLRRTWPDTDPWAAMRLLDAASSWYAAYPLLALTVALAVAAGAWRPDHRTAHVYALTLPIDRRVYLLLRYAAGVVLFLVVAAALWVGALLAVVGISLPPLLHAYPGGLVLRFCLAGLTAYTVLYGLYGLTARMARLLVAALLVLVLVTAAADLMALHWSPLPSVIDALLGPYSPLGVFRARWMLIDV
jgi:hypothetical protein